MNAKAKIRQIAKLRGSQFVIDCATNGLSAHIATQEEITEIRNCFKLSLGVSTLAGISMADLLQALENPNLIERIGYRKQTAASAG